MSGEPASYAVTEALSRGRIYPEKPHPYRSDFERDRDRIIHCSAFRRLEGKTQVFTPGLDDYYRTRLTHSIEVAQIGRTIAKALRLNENLTEAVCLAHDLGHSPFGHAGEMVLNELMAGFGGFEHNRQSLRIVDLLERPYPHFPGLNLMYETRLSLARHRTPYDRSEDRTFSEPNCPLEGQVAGIADRIAMNSHDLEDGMRAGLIDIDRLRTVQIFAEAQNQLNAESIEDRAIRRTRIAKVIIDRLVGDCILAGSSAIARANIETVDDVCAAGRELIVLSEQSQAALVQLEEFLLNNFYRHESLIQTARNVNRWLTELFEKICRGPQIMPAYYRQLAAKESLQRTVCDYIAGMTDRYCLKMLGKI